MGDDTDAVDLGALPRWSERLIDRLDDEYGITRGELAERNFPDGRPPRWLRGTATEGGGDAPDWIQSFCLDADPAVRRLWVEEGFLSTDPGWLETLVTGDEADVARVFLLTGNVDDYAFSPDSGYLPAIDRIEENAAKRKDWVIRYSLSNGFERPVRGEATPEDDPSPFEDLDVDPDGRDGASRTRSPQEALDGDIRVMEELLERSYDGGIALIVDNLHLLSPPDSANVNQNVVTDAIKRWARSPSMFQSENQVVLLAGSSEGLTRDLRVASSHIETIDVPRPEDRGDRLKFLAALYAGARVVPMSGIRLDGATRPRFEDRFGSGITEQLRTLAERTSGLNLVGLENLVLRVNAGDEPQFSAEYVKRAKRDQLAQESGGILEVSEPDPGVDPESAFEGVGGLEAVKERLIRIGDLMERAGTSETVRRSLPSGLLFLGPPGTGKTLVARAFANACGVNFAELGNIRSMYVGESERNLSQALDLIRSLTPVVVFMDEIDQTMGRRGSGDDSGVDRRLFARILQFMSDPELDGQVIWIAASNEPTHIDPALKRAGRFDLTVPFVRPDAEGRRAILRVHLRDRDATVDLSASDWEWLLDRTAGFTGAELERVAKEAVWTELSADGETDDVTVDGDSVRAALSAYSPPANRREFRRMEDDALVEVTSVDMLTESQRERRERLVNGE